MWARSRHYNQTGHPTTKLFKGGNLAFLLSDCSDSQGGELDRQYKDRVGGGVKGVGKKQHFVNKP